MTDKLRKLTNQLYEQVKTHSISYDKVDINIVELDPEKRSIKVTMNFTNPNQKLRDLIKEHNKSKSEST